ncbi:Protein of unknown function [Pyronema omphalodes CBS 100304]|uniref:Uncharacterized protein n=1 Tax=Pyronema omphalodes (strain CBS 100304) TaxID=1076935 RepID=U4LUC2_PYROM|nr:Protein of unknown function [Pyronema omphalodes CBS 100304]
MEIEMRDMRSSPSTPGRSRHQMTGQISRKLALGWPLAERLVYARLGGTSHELDEFALMCWFSE